MRAQVQNALDVMAVMGDKGRKQAEVVDVNIIYLESYQIFRLNHTAQICLRVGGVSSNKCQSPCHDYDDKIARLNIVDPLFSELFIDEYGNLKTVIDESTFQRMYVEIVKAGDNLVWGFPKGTKIDLVDDEGKVIQNIIDK